MQKNIFQLLRVSFTSLRYSSSVRPILDPKFDIAFKKVFGDIKNKSITKQFIKDITDVQVEDLIFIDSHVSTDIVTQSPSRVDVLCTSTTGDKFLIEIQRARQSYFGKRTLYYASKIYSGQVETGHVDYSALKKVIIIAIAEFSFFLDNPYYISRHRLLDTETLKCAIDDLMFVFIDLEKFTPVNVDQLKTASDVWCYYLKFIHKIDSRVIDDLKQKHSFITPAIEQLKRFNLEPKEYEKYLLYSMGLESDAQDKIDYANDMKRAIARKLLEKGVSIEVICKATDLKKEDFE